MSQQPTAAPRLRLLLAPMEGILDHHLRETLTAVGGVDHCVSEFIRVTDQLLPNRAFRRLMPELLNGSRTRAGTPVRAQLLGSDPACLADNAAALSCLQPEGIDLNFGCPAPTVNRHRGGAVLLDEPELVHAIVAAVRRAVPAHLPVSAKMRLGNQDASRMLDCARAIESAGASELVVHGRTKLQGYRPPAHWQQIGQIREALAISVVANGEVWNVDDARQCLLESGCQSLMLGRGMVADPGLALALRRALGAASDAHVASAAASSTDFPAATQSAGLEWAALQPLMQDYWLRMSAQIAPKHRSGRIKQWINLLRRRYPQAQTAWDRIRSNNDALTVEHLLFGGGTDDRADDSPDDHADDRKDGAAAVRDTVMPAPALT